MRPRANYRHHVKPRLPRHLPHHLPTHHPDRHHLERAARRCHQVQPECTDQAVGRGHLERGGDRDQPGGVHRLPRRHRCTQNTILQLKPILYKKVNYIENQNVLSLI